MSKLGNIVIFQSHYMYCAYWSYQYTKAFRELGYNVSYIGINELENYDYIERVLTGDCKLAISFNPPPLSYFEDDVSVYDKYGIPHIHVIIDHMEHFAHLIMKGNGHLIDNLHFGLYDIIDMDYIEHRKAFPKAKYFSLLNTGFEATNCRRSFEERKYDVSFCGGGVSLDHNNYWGKYTTCIWKKTAMVIADMLINNVANTAFEAFKMLDGSSEFDFDDEEWRQLSTIFATAEDYLRRVRRNKLITGLANEGVRIHAFGPKEEYESLGNPNIIYEGTVSYRQSIEIIGNSKLTPNTAPLTQWSVTDRLISVIANGTVAVTDANNCTRAMFEDGKHMLFYNYSDLGSAAAKINDLLSNTDKWNEISQNARNAYLAAHTPKHRAQYMLDYIDGKISGMPNLE